MASKTTALKESHMGYNTQIDERNQEQFAQITSFSTLAFDYSALIV